MLLEAHTPKQLDYEKGRLPAVEMMMDSRILTEELKGLDFIDINEEVREIQEGEFHKGKGTVVQLLAKKP